MFHLQLDREDDIALAHRAVELETYKTNLVKIAVKEFLSRPVSSAAAKELLAAGYIRARRVIEPVSTDEDWPN